MLCSSDSSDHQALASGIHNGGCDFCQAVDGQDAFELQEQTVEETEISAGEMRMMATTASGSVMPPLALYRSLTGQACHNLIRSTSSCVRRSLVRS